MSVCHLLCVAAGAVEFSKVDVLIANPLRLKALEAQGKVDLSKVGVGVLKG